jgi:hypothetical protein
MFYHRTTRASLTPRAGPGDSAATDERSGPTHFGRRPAHLTTTDEMPSCLRVWPDLSGHTCIMAATHTEPAQLQCLAGSAPNSFDIEATVGPRDNERVQQRSTAVSPLLSALQRGSPTLSVPQQHSAGAAPSLRDEAAVGSNRAGIVQVGRCFVGVRCSGRVVCNAVMPGRSAA